MKHSELSRRQLLVRSLWLGGGVAAGLGLPRPRALAAAAASGSPEIFSKEEWETTEAITARLIPTDHEPGAVEAGCVNFIDKALANEDAGLRSLYTAGLRGIDAVARAEGATQFALLPPEKQDAVLRALEDGSAAAWPAGAPTSPDFFAQVWQHTLWGFLAEPQYGGNRDYAGWRVLGYPGGRHRLGGYTPEQMAGRAKVESVWGEKLPRSAAKDTTDE
ncbi:MAG: gluconate 2-dehydrogenase subunit 3 family protein [Myxococcota bacterium]